MVQHVSLQLSSVIVVVSLLSSPEARNSKGLSFYFRQDWANYNYLGTKSVLHQKDKLVIFCWEERKQIHHLPCYYSSTFENIIYM